MKTEEVKDEEGKKNEEQNANVSGESVGTVAKDPSFNCPDCAGEGLLANGNLCSKCDGTGKAKPENFTYRPGTQVIRKDGTYIVNDLGQEIKQEVK